MKQDNMRDVKLGVQYDVDDMSYSLIILKTKVEGDETRRDDYDLAKWQAEMIAEFLGRPIERIYPRGNII